MVCNLYLNKLILCLSTYLSTYLSTFPTNAYGQDVFSLFWWLHYKFYTLNSFLLQSKPVKQELVSTQESYIAVI